MGKVTLQKEEKESEGESQIVYIDFAYINRSTLNKKIKYNIGSVYQHTDSWKYLDVFMRNLPHTTNYITFF